MRTSDFMLDYYSVKKNGNWEPGKNILFRTFDDDAFVLEKGFSR